MSGGGIGGAITDVSGAVGDLFAAEGDAQSAAAYGQEQQIALQNEAITKRSTAITEQQEQRTITQAEGTTSAGVAGAGMTAGGSALYLMRSNVQQGALSKQLIANQGEITAQGYAEQAVAAGGQEASAKAAAAGQEAGAAGGILGAVASIVSWIICTELVKQRRLPLRWYTYGAQVWRYYPDEVKEGYYVWAVPSVRHLRRYPNSLYSRFLCAIFNWRAENITAHAGVPGARKLWRGVAVTAILWPICYAIGYVRIKLNRRTNWELLYAEH